MKVRELDFALPSDLMCYGPQPIRGRGAKLLVVHRDTGKIEHREWAAVTEYLAGQDVWVNVSKLNHWNIRIYSGRGHEIDVDLCKEVGPLTFVALVRMAGNIVEQNRLSMLDGVEVENLGRCGSSGELEAEGAYFLLRFLSPPDFDRLGAPVLPAYARKPSGREQWPWYEPVYASVPGTCASPSAGINFTEEQLAALNVKRLVLHADVTSRYTMQQPHSVEYHAGFIRPEPFEFLDDPPTEPVACIGTTVVKAMESYARTGRREGASALFVSPPFEFKLTKSILTNLHLPQEMFIAMTAAFADAPLIKRAFAEAIERKYRWYIYGDSMLIL